MSTLPANMPFQPSPLRARVDAALETCDQQAIEEIAQEIFASIKDAGGEVKKAAPLLGVHYLTLKKVIEDLDLRGEIQKKFPGRRKERAITVGKVTHTSTEWAEITGVPRHTINERLRRGYSPEEAISTVDLRETRKKKR